MFTNAQRKIPFSYLPFYLVVVLLQRHAFLRGPMTPLEWGR